MNYKKVLRGISLMFASQLLFLAPMKALAEETNNASETELTEEAKKGMALFQGGKLLDNGGPSCITCHNVTNDQVIPGGLFAKDLTDVYTRFGDGLALWLTAPSNNPMEAAYKNNEITEEERLQLTAFFKYVNAVKDSQTANSGSSLFLVGGGVGVVILLVLIQVLWNKRKKKMTKQDIFNRQNSAWDAKF
ncbi:MAG: hypothetical protein R2799_04480 [Crocinitomicaceae bacterium]|nr:hypothetical protein [Crocinitomicaceae bacterium]